MKFKDVAYVIIDEISMLSCHNFDFVNKRLCEIKDTTSDPTGGLSLIVFGDLNLYMVAIYLTPGNLRATMEEI